MRSKISILSLSLVVYGLLLGTNAWACEKPKIINYRNTGCLIEGLAIAQKDDKYGFVDNDGNVIIPFQYDNFSAFEEGVAMVKKMINGVLLIKQGKL